MDKPLLIGISARIYYPGSQGPLPGVFTKTLHYLEQSVAHWVLSGHAMAVMIPAVTRDSIVTRSDLTLPDYANALDGLVLQGGNDVAPESYDESPLHPDWAGDRIRDRYEMELVNAFLQAGKPVFGICRGLQLINVAHGGTLYQDISTQKDGSLVHRDADAYDLNFHHVEIVPRSRLAQLLGETRHKINSVHHQGVKDLAPGFVVEAVSPHDGVIEAIRHTGEAWVAAVQWHPEFHRPELGVVDDTPLLHDFLAAAQAARNA